MKSIKLLSLFLFISFSVVAFSQNDTDTKKVKFQVRGGMNISTLFVDSDDHFESEKSKIGYNIGGVADISLGKNLYLQPGLSFTAKGSEMRQMPVESHRTEDMTMNALYLQVPVYLAYKLKLGYWPNSLNIAAGPYFAYGVGGKISGGIYEANTFGNKGLANRTDVGLGMEMHFEMPKVLFIYGFETGFTKMLKREYFNVNARNFNVYLGMGYKF